MAQSMRFGRRIPLPSTRQIIHELRVYAAKEDERIIGTAAKPALAPDDAVLVPTAPHREL